MKYKVIIFVIFIFVKILYGNILKFEKNLQNRRWRISSTIGFLSENTSSEIEKWMSYYGFNETSPANLFSEATAHPFIGDRVSFDFSISCIMNKRYSLALYYFYTQFCIFGYHRFPVETYFNINYNLNNFSLLYIFYPFKFAQFGIGCGITKLKLTTEQFLNYSYFERKIRPSILIQASIYIPYKTRFFMRLTGNAVFLLKERVGPIIAYKYYDFSDGILQSFKINPSFLYFGIGYGVYF